MTDVNYWLILNATDTPLDVYVPLYSYAISVQLIGSSD